MASVDQHPDKPLVLVIDDDPDLLKLAEVQLREDFEVLAASNGRDGLDLARSRLPEAIVLDIMMPNMDGITVLDTLRENSPTAAIPVICLSALTQVEDRVRGLEHGAVDFMIKPADRRELVARLWAAVRRRRREQLEAALVVADPVTGLPDRKAFQERLREEIHRARRSHVPFSILVLDVDGMALINERVGRERGDRLLEQIAGRLQATLRASDVVFRHGDDSFAAVLPDSDAGTAFVAAERARSAVAAIEGGTGCPISIGVAEHSPGHSADELLARAEVALFRAKESGGNIAWRSDDLRRRALNPRSLAEELTDREWDVLAYLSQRYTEHQIAARLGISSGTVRSHKARIRRKLAVRPDMRLGDFVAEHFADLSHRLNRTGA